MSELNPSWASYLRSQKELIASFSRQLNSFPSILTLPPQNRGLHRQSIIRSVRNLTRTRILLQEAISSLKEFETEVVRCAAEANAALTPFSALPPEVLLSIIKLVVGLPSNIRGIMKLSHVSKMWRDLVLDTSELFTHADWNRWHWELIRVWNTRAKQQPLSITLLNDTFNFLYGKGHYSNPESLVTYQALQQEFHAALTKCSSLSLTFQNVWNAEDSPDHPVQMIATKCTNLLHLSITCPQQMVDMNLDYFQTLKTLRVDGILPTFSADRQISTIHCDILGAEASIREYRFLSQLVSLSLYSLQGDNFSMLEEEVAEIASLRYLEIRPYRRSEQIELILLFDYLKVPNVEHFTLNAITLSEDGDEDEVFWPAIAHAMPRLTSITLKRDRVGYWPLGIPLEGLHNRNNGSLFKHLWEFRILGRDVEHLLQPILDLIVSRTPPITHLTLPPRSEFEGAGVTLWDSMHDLISNFTVEDIGQVCPLHGSGLQTLPPPLSIFGDSDDSDYDDHSDEDDEDDGENNSDTHHSDD